MGWAVLIIALVFIHGWLYWKEGLLHLTAAFLWLVGAAAATFANGPEIAWWLLYLSFWFWWATAKTAEDAPLQVNPFHTRGVKYVLGAVGLVLFILRSRWS